MTSLGKKLFRDLYTLRAQAATIAILVICGISILVSSWSSFRSLKRAQNEYYEISRFADVFADFVRAPSQIIEQAKAIAGVEFVEGRITEMALVDVPAQTEPALGQFISLNDSSSALNKVYLRKGRYPNGGSNLEIVVHEGFAQAHHLKIGDHLSVLMKGQKRNFTICGIGISPEYIYALSPLVTLPDDKHFGVFWMNKNTFDILLKMEGSINSLIIRKSNQSSVGYIKQELNQILKPYGGREAYDRSQQLSHKLVEDEITQQRVMAIVVPGVFLTVAAFILNIVISRVVALHRTQIGMLKSMGYSSFSLSLHYFNLVTIMVILGVIPSLFLGQAIGLWYSELYKNYFRFPSIDFTLSLDSVVVGCFAGLIPGWIGSWTALRSIFTLVPVEAMRPQSPVFSKKYFFIFLDQVFEAKNALDVRSKMVVRNLLNRPVRLLMSIIGICAAMAVLINGSFWKDMIDFMMDRQFRQMSHEDISVSFSHPKGIDVFQEFKSMPGVLMVEGSRNVPVRFRYEHRKKETVIMGIEKENRLKRIFDINGKLIEPRAGGVLLSRYFELQYGIKKGDVIEFEVLEGALRKIKVPVFGIVDDLVGSVAYAVKEDLHRWLQEEPVVDSVQLLIEPSYAQTIYLDLKQKPEVLSVTTKKLLLKSFSDTIAGMIRTFTAILIIFSVAIAGAVLYNTMRISYSEREWELASLRILGLTNFETFSFLFHEIALLLLVGIAPGLLLGYWLASLYTNMIQSDTFNFPLIIESSTYALAVLVMCATLLLSGIFLYGKISRINFSYALKARD